MTDQSVALPRRSLLSRLVRRVLIPREEWVAAFRDPHIRRLVALSAIVNLVCVVFILYLQFTSNMDGRTESARRTIQAANVISLLSIGAMVALIVRYGVQAVSVAAPAMCALLSVAVCVASYGSLLSSHSPVAFAINTHWLLMLYITNPMCFRPLGARLLSGLTTAAVVGMGVARIVQQGGFVPGDTMHRAILISCEVFITGLLMQETAFVVREKRAARVSAARQSLRDLRRQRAIERELRTAREDVMRLNRVSTVNAVASTIAHEVRQPLAAASNLAAATRNWLRRDPPNLARAEASLESLGEEVQRASTVIEEIRALTTRREAETAALDVGELVRSAAHLVSGEVARLAGSLEIEVPADAGVLWGRRVQLQQVLLNLLHNAVEAFDGATQPRIVVSVETRPDESLRIRVADNGPGMTPQQLENIRHGLYTTKADGAGLGIMICRQILEAHGGHLTLDSSPEGTTVTLMLPRNAPAA